MCIFRPKQYAVTVNSEEPAPQDEHWACCHAGWNDISVAPMDVSINKAFKIIKILNESQLWTFQG